MTLKDMMGKVMVALDEVTSFDLIGNLEDYKFKIYECMDSTQRELATICAPIVKNIAGIADGGTMPLPTDLYELISIYDENYVNADFVYIKPDLIRIQPGTYRIIYNSYPSVVNERTAEDYEFEISKDAQEAMIYGVCALLCINDEPDLYRTYMSRYTTYMNNIISRREQKPRAVIKGGIDL